MAEEKKLTEYSRFSGCGAKLGPGLLDKALCGLSQPKRPEILADFSGSEDAGVYKINSETALVQTIDFFPPIVDSPGLFGEIAAANALSDIYAMGGTPITAVNVLCFPEGDLSLEILRMIMDGALGKLIEAGTALLGGHSVSDKELKFGFAVNGTVHPDRIIRNNTPREGDCLILTKPLGTGTINTALKAGLASTRAVSASETSMSSLNKTASLLMKKYKISACTDITGFGLAGHSAELILNSGLELEIFTKDLPLLPDVMEYISMGLVPEGTFRNRQFRESMIQNPKDVPSETMDLLFDPQTSGGLLISLPEMDGRGLLKELQEAGINAAVIGSIKNGTEGIILNA